MDAVCHLVFQAGLWAEKRRLALSVRQTVWQKKENGATPLKTTSPHGLPKVVAFEFGTKTSLEL